MAGTTEALWARHEELRRDVAGLSERMAGHDARYDAVVEKLDESRRERTQQFETLLKEIKEARTEVAEARGAVSFGKWLAGILISLGVPAALFAWYSHK